ncbi:hypothetical protein J2S13_002696 [Oikeobacillus pervagus]|uniref:Uncharacterized protein n=1 Tax=Oikeobacillus pervagus TaxID=1325931 RepID=A0AAJ1WK15_9BACI|nr:hypothetical protein [Oikeobacillus pervagus]MDQ0216255.1 hypothetical protein [Oikeobacillus pervagus]
MRWEAFGGTAVIIVVIILFQWPKVKQNPAKDKIAFFMLLVIGWGLSMFDLPHMGGPLTWIEALLKPFARFMET